MGQKFSVEKITFGIPGYISKEKRKCRECRKVMRPHVEWRKGEPGEVGVNRYTYVEVPARVAYYGYGREGIFCSLRCAYVFACAAVRGCRCPVSPLE